MALWDLLKKDHREVATLFTQISKTDDDAKREELFDEIAMQLELHATVEEKYFYPALRHDEQTKDLVREALEEHQEVKALLQEISKLEPGDEEWASKVETLKTNVQHHVEEEETEMFPKAQKVLDTAQIAEIARKIEEEKKAAHAG